MTRLETNREHVRARRQRSVSALPPARHVPILKRTFLVRCTACGRRFQVDRAPAPCPSCGGVAVAG